MDSFEIAAKLVCSGKRINLPHPDDTGKRIVGWVIDAEDVGLSTALFALQRIENKYKKEE